MTVLWVLVLAACEAGSRSAVSSCRAPTLDPALQRSLLDVLTRRLRVSGDTSALPTADKETAGVPLAEECVGAATFSWSGGFGGAVVLFRSRDSGAEVLSVQFYPGAHAPIAAGTGRMLFSYSGGRGSGQRAERTAVLCSLAADNWVPCADVLTTQEVTATGYPAADALAARMHLSSRGQVTVQGDTLRVVSEIDVKRYGQPVSRRTVTWYQVLP
jgi:hypothetical protein